MTDTTTAAAEVAEITPLTVHLPDGRAVAVWRCGPDRPATPGRVALVAPGFARRMRHMAPFARYLVANGFVVYRCDYVDHIGLSDGEIWDFSFTDMYESLAAVHRHVLAAEGVDAVVVVAASLAARPAFRLAATAGGVSGIVGVVGVVNPRYTLENVFGIDYAGRAFSDFGAEEYALFENKRVHCLPFVRDWHAGDWLDATGTARDLAAVDCPIVNFCGSADGWIDVAEVKEVFAAARGPARVVELSFVEHELSRNPVAAQTMLREVVRHSVEFATGEPPSDTADPGFAAIAVQIPYERSLETEDRSVSR